MTFLPHICRVAAAFLLTGLIGSAQAVPIISSMSPSNGPTSGNSSITLSGAGFGTDISSVSVSFNGLIAALNSITDNEISFASPAYAGGDRLVAVAVTIGSDTSNQINFLYDAPALFSINPADGPSLGGGVITVTGNNFGTSIASLDLTIGGVSTTILSVSHSEISALIPAFSGGSLSKSVMLSGGGASSNIKTFTYDAVPVPTPAPLAALVVGLLGITVMHRKRSGFKPSTSE